jgi:TRAP-type C4-dicarboxylate transport system permease small subunit
MAALLLFALAVAGGAIVGDLVWENTAAAEVTVFNQPVRGYPQGWLLGAAAALGFLTAFLLVASLGATRRRRERRRQLRQLRRNRRRQVAEPESEQERPSMLDQWFGHNDTRP